MKNMMSQVRNFKVLALCALSLIALTGCKSKNEPVQPVDPQTETIVGNVSKPDWTSPSEYDLMSSMTAIVKVDLSQSFTTEQLADWQPAADDMLAAFDGTTCLGMTTPQDGLFFLFISAPQEGNEVLLKYYSTAVKNIFTATEPVPYKNNTRLGTVSDPYKPKWAVAK